MAQFWNCPLNCLPHGQCTEISNFLTFCPHFHQLMRNKRVVSEEDPEIRPFSRESYYTSIQSPFLQHFFSFFLPVRYFFQYPFLPSPKADVTKADVTSPFSCAIWCSWHLEDEGVSCVWYGQLSWQGKRNRSFRQRENNRRDEECPPESVWPVRSEGVGSSEHPSASSAAMEQVCRKWGLSCLCPMLSFCPHFGVLCVVHFPLSVALKAVLEATCMY